MTTALPHSTNPSKFQPLQAGETAIPLDQLSRGTRAVVENISSSDEQRHRLASLGLRAGVVVMMIMGGHSCAIAVNDTRLMVSRQLLQTILVTPIG